MNKLADIMKFDEKGLVPAIVQEDATGKVLMLAYMDRQALEESLKTGYTHFYSRSRQKLWKKGETSGHVQKIVSISPDCDCDALLVRVEQEGAACHTGHHSCFFTRYCEDLQAKSGQEDFEPEKVGATSQNILNELFEVICDRKRNPREGSYTCYLFEKGLDKILKKVGEESSEVIIASKNGSREELTLEIADLVYHLFVLMSECGLSPEDIYEELKRRR